MGTPLKANRAYPSIPDPGDTLAMHSSALQAIKHALEVHERRTKESLDSFLRLRELVNLDILRVRGNQIVLGDAFSTEAAAADSGDGGGSGVSDHGALTGLLDDDHTQYVLRSILTTNGDIFTRIAGAVSRLGVGSEGQVLSVVSGLPSWQNSAAADAHGWRVDEIIEVTSSQAIAADFPSSGVFDTDREYRIEFNGWRLASSGNFHGRVDVGGGIISSTDYERSHTLQVAGSSSSDISSGASGVILIGISCAANAYGAGYIQFIPGLQASAKAPIEVECRYVHSGGNVARFEGIGGLSTPTSSAIEKIRMYDTGVNTVAGTFVLKSRPLVPSL